MLNSAQNANVESLTTFGELLRYLRRRAGLTLKELGAAVGYSESQVARLEGGQRLPDVLAIKTQFAEALRLQTEPQLLQHLVKLATVAHPPRSAPPTVPARAAPRHNLPQPLTHLIDRERDIAALQHLICHSDHRLITLLGSPGVGKTSLAIEAVRASCEAFIDGAWLASLATITDPAMVPAVIAQALGVETNLTQPLDSLERHLRDKHMLLVLDNFEQVLDAAMDVAVLLGALPRVKIIVTSRAALRMTGECLFEVTPLRDAPAVEMFLDRAAAIRPDLEHTAQLRDTVARICSHLDGLPLAIEIAVARLRLFSPPALLARLEHRDTRAGSGVLDLLSDGPRNLPARQRTLRATFEWSYELLTPSQQRLLRAMSVFSGGCALAALEAIVNPGASDIFLTDNLQALVEGSLVQRHDSPQGEPRFTLLTVIREYAAEQLIACAETAEAHQRHLHYYLEYVIANAPGICRRMDTPASAWLAPMEEHGHWIRCLREERDNLLAALEWGLRAGHEPRAGVELAVWQSPLWGIFGPWKETTSWLELALQHCDPQTQPRQCALIQSQLSSYLVMVDTPRAEALATESIKTIRQYGTPQELLFLLPNTATVELERNNLEHVKSIASEVLALTTALNIGFGRESALFQLSEVALAQKDLEHAEVYIEQTRQARALLLHERGAPPHLDNLSGNLACFRGHYLAAAKLCRAALESFDNAGFTHGVATVQHSLGDIALFQGKLAEALVHFQAGLRLFSTNANRQRSTWCLAGIAAVLAMAEEPEQAMQFWANVEAIRTSIGSPRPPMREDDYRLRVDAARDALGNYNGAISTLGFERTVEAALALTAKSL